MITLDGIECFLHVIANTLQSKTERVDARLQALQQLDVHQALNTLFALFDTQAMARRAFLLFIFIELTIQNKSRGRIDGQSKRLKLLEYLIVVDSCIKVSEMRLTRNRLQTLRESADICRIIILLDMLAATCNGNSIQEFEEIKTEHTQKALCGTFFRRQICPDVIGCLCLAEDIINTTICRKQLIE